MRVFIITEGGKDIGFGHIMRCTSVYQAFEEREIEPELIVNGDETISSFTKNKNCRMLDWLNDRETLFAVLRDADIVFVDSYLADSDLYGKVSDIAGIGVFFDDNVRMDYPKSLVVNGTVLAERMPYPKRDGVRYLLGTQYAPLRREFWDVPEKSINNTLETVVITFGGADICNLTPKVLKLLQDVYPQLFKKVIVGNGFQNIAEIEKLEDNNTELIYSPSATRMRDIMLESDVAISSGGQTLYELARVGVPTICICVADNQLQNIKGWQEVGFAEYAGEGKDEELSEEISRKIELLEGRNARQCKSRLGRNLVDGRGSLRISREVLSDFHKKHLILRKATLADAKDLLNLANDEIVRHNSFSQDKIEWASHSRWLNERLGDGNCLFLIVACLGKFAGQVRFDMTPLQSEAVINISLCGGIRGLGLSSFVINKSIKNLQKMRGDVKLIKAYVKNGNIASVKAFENAGFSFLEDTTLNKCEAKVYEKTLGKG